MSPFDYTLAMSLTLDELTLLKSELPTGAIVKLAKRLRLSQSFVSMVLNGKRASDTVIRRAIAMRDQERVKAANLRKALRKTTNN